MSEIFVEREALQKCFSDPQIILTTINLEFNSFDTNYFSEFDACFNRGTATGILRSGRILPRRRLLQVTIEFLLHFESYYRSFYDFRVTPMQKAEVVELVKKSVGAITLAIGDGAK